MDIPTYEDLIKQIKRNFWLLGIPYDDPKIYIRFFLMFLTVFVMSIEEIFFIISKISTEDLLVITQLVPCSCIGVLSLLKIVCLAAKRHKIFKLTHSLKDLYINTIKEEEKKEIIRGKVVMVKVLTKYFLILNGVLISVYNFSTPIFILYDYFLSGEVKFHLPYAVIVPFRTDVWPNWLAVYIHSIMSGFICVLFFTTIDVLYCILTSHICNNFAVISAELKKLNKDNVQYLGNIVKKHQHIIELSDELEDIFNLPNLFNVLVGSVEICALGFNVTVALNSTFCLLLAKSIGVHHFQMGSLTQMPGCVLFLTSVLLQILMMSVFGENLIQESRNVGDAVFSCEWYNLDAKSRKVILFIMTRVNKHQRLTAYKFSTISYGSFSKIISTSWSYFTILKTVYKPPEAN